jgi:prevent-host-death family protein
MKRPGKPYSYSGEEITTSEARDRFADTLNRAAYGKERVVIRRHGRGVAAVVPIEDLESLELMEDAADLLDARKALAEVKKKGAVPWGKVKKDLGL